MGVNREDCKVYALFTMNAPIIRMVHTPPICFSDNNDNKQKKTTFEHVHDYM